MHCPIVSYAHFTVTHNVYLKENLLWYIPYSYIYKYICYTNLFIYFIKKMSEIKINTTFILSYVIHFCELQMLYKIKFNIQIITHVRSAR
jgi:hypothetical protein